MYIKKIEHETQTDIESQLLLDLLCYLAKDI